ncbi:uncharacterized protein LOC125206287 [Salvia hispanica]|uniref:uncharacterized protein LOC125206287 n=1 Tax=Salvia hispanica TaxID=49212 RepID=UPI0020097C30|nr:uncharacterized protein LOC125206287 [Salvia hispanica]
MRRELFLRIVNGLSVCYPNFQQHWDATGKPGLSPLQKCMTAIRQLAYGGCADMFDEYLHVADTTGRDCLKKFCKGVIETFGPTYLRKPTAQDCQFLLDLHWRVHGFPAVADQRLLIWHAYFGVAGSNNDLNVLQSSPLFNDQC